MNNTVPYTALDVLQNVGETVGHIAASAATVAGLPTLVLTGIEGANLFADQPICSKLHDNYTVTHRLCGIMQFTGFFTYIASGQAAKVIQNALGRISLMERIAFFVTDVATAILTAKDITAEALSRIVTEDVSKGLTVVATTFSGFGFIFGIAHASKRLHDRDQIIPEEKTEFIIKASLDLSCALLSLATCVATLALMLFGVASTIATPMILSFGAAAAALGMAQAAYAAYAAYAGYGDRHIDEEPLKLSPAAEVAAASFNVLSELTQNSDGFNLICKAIPAAAEFVNIECVQTALGISAAPKLLTDISGICKTYSKDLGALAIFKRISEFLLPEADGKYFWQNTQKNDLKIAKLSFLTGANAIETAQYVSSVLGVEVKPLSDLLAKCKIGQLEASVLTKNAFVVLSSILGIADASRKIHKDKDLIGILATRRDLWHRRRAVNDPLDIDNCRGRAIAKLRVKVAEEQHKIDTASTHLERCAAENAQAKLKTTKRKLKERDRHGNFVVDVTTFATYKIDKLNAKIRNWRIDYGKNIIGIINDIMKTAIVAMTTVGSGLDILILAPFKIAVTIFGGLTTLVAIVKAIYEAAFKRAPVLDIVEYIAHQNRKLAW